LLLPALAVRVASVTVAERCRRVAANGGSL